MSATASRSRRSVLAALVAAGICALLGAQASAKASKSMGFPNLLLPAVTGAPDGPSLHRGRPVLVNAWASWCPACRSEIPAFIQPREVFPDPLTIIGINEGEPFKDVSRAAAELAIPYIVLADPRQLLEALFGIDELPFTVAVAPNGTIENVVIGAMSLERMLSLAKASL